MAQAGPHHHQLYHHHYHCHDRHHHHHFHDQHQDHLHHADYHKQGVLGKLGNPGKVLGVDISDDMISHCSNHYNGQENLAFEVVKPNWNIKLPFHFNGNGKWILPNFLPRPWMCQMEQTSAKQESPPSTWQVNLLLASPPIIKWLLATSLQTRWHHSPACTGYQTNLTLSLCSTKFSNQAGSFSLWWVELTMDM